MSPSFQGGAHHDAVHGKAEYRLFRCVQLRTGYPDGSYKPEKSVSRAEFLTLFARIAFPDEWKRVEGEEWWKSAYEVCTAHDLLNNITGSRSEAMPRGEIAALLERFCSGWGGVHERADAAEQYVINWKEQRMEFPEWQPLFPDAAEYRCR